MKHTGENGVDNRRFINAVFWRLEYRDASYLSNVILVKVCIYGLRDGGTREFNSTDKAGLKMYYARRDTQKCQIHSSGKRD